ncbi:DUF1236 domain-containing protein [Phyllobacterium zundukense]|jgi:hypothetical protein|uniref:DUF1236 domain-containing protein n=1 Tax=Phyllobacterium zundukense TaxID=1867719 RepID=A0ACD4D4R4_9HYPH|nr:DUF1236 domain-containing protein [Phyllobacterium zundukense]UXN60730.1 DUF1236 domain-containing protein [Phyllobacterium zundukense]
MKKIFMVTAATFFAASGLAIAQDGVVVEVPQSARDYVIAHPADPVVIEGDLSQGYVVPETIVVRPIPESPGYGYIYVDGRPVIVSMENREVVYLSDDAGIAPRAVPDEVISYIETNPTDPVVIDGDITTGTVIPDDVPLVAVPDQPRYSYVYVQDRPALIERETRRVVWVR